MLGLPTFGGYEGSEAGDDYMSEETMVISGETSQELDETDKIGITEKESAVTDIAIVDEGILRDKIYEIRGAKVMPDFELAEIYGYQTKNFN